MSYKRIAFIILILILPLIILSQPITVTIAKPLDETDFYFTSSKRVAIPGEQLSFTAIVDSVVGLIVIRDALDHQLGNHIQTLTENFTVIPWTIHESTPVNAERRFICEHFDGETLLATEELFVHVYDSWPLELDEMNFYGVNTNASTVIPRVPVNVSGWLTSDGGGFTFIDGGYFSLYDVTNASLPRILVASIYCLDNSQSPFQDYPVNLTVIIPWWTTAGVHAYELEYSGDPVEFNLQSCTYRFNLTVLDQGYLFVLTPEELTLERSGISESCNLPLTVEIGGDDPTGLIFQGILEDPNGIVRHEWTTQSLTDNFVEELIESENDWSLGTYLLNVSLILDTTIIHTEKHNLTLYDETGYNFCTNTTSYQPGNVVAFELTVYEEDYLTRALSATVSYDNWEGQVITDNTSLEGTISGEVTIPNNASAGDYELVFDVQPVNQFVQPIIIVENLKVVEDVTIVPSVPANAFRQTVVSLSATVLASDQTVTEGKLTLKTSLGSILAEVFLPETLHYDWEIPADCLVDSHAFYWEYREANHYSEATITSSITVLSRPMFVNVSVSETTVRLGQSFRITGYLVDENLEGLFPSERVYLIELLGGGESQELASYLTEPNGVFIFDVSTNVSWSTGLHFFTLQSHLNLTTYRYSANLSETLVVSYSDPLGIGCTEELFSGSTVNLTLVGPPLFDVVIYWCVPGKVDWSIVTTTQLSQTGLAIIPWIVPQIRGTGFVQVRIPNDPNHTAIKEVTFYATPQVYLGNFPDSALVGEELSFNLTSDTRFKVIFDDQVYSTWLDASEDPYAFVVPIDSKGEHTLRIDFDDLYVSPNCYTYSLIGWEEIQLTTSIPNVVAANTTTSIEIFVMTTRASMPVQGLDCYLLVNDGLVAQAVSDFYGKVNFLFSFRYGVNNLSFVVNPLGNNSYLPLTYNISLTVKYTPTLWIDDLVTRPDSAFSISARLSGSTGLPLPNQCVFFVYSPLKDNGEEKVNLGNATTDDKGIATISYSTCPLDPGSYRLFVSVEESTDQFPVMMSAYLDVTTETGPTIEEPQVQIDEDAFMFSCTATGATTVLLYLNDVDYLITRIAGTNDYSLRLTLLPGDYNVTFVADDGVGNHATINWGTLRVHEQSSINSNTHIEDEPNTTGDPLLALTSVLVLAILSACVVFVRRSRIKGILR